MKYVIIIPAKNEEQDLPNTLKSICSQTRKPEMVLVVDDGSTDNTKGVVSEFAKDNAFIKIIERKSAETVYSLGGKVVEVFNYGLGELSKMNVDYDFVLKMDADVVFESTLFEELEKRIDKEEMLGIASCTPYYEDENKGRVVDNSPDWHTNGQFKIYNKNLFSDIVGLMQDLGWDCADNIQAIEKGWKTLVYKDLYYKLSRPIGRFSVKKGAVRQGIGAYKLRYNFLYVLLKVLHDSLRKPYLLLGFYYLQGYIKAHFKYRKRTLTRKQGKLLRKLLWDSMFSRMKNKEYMVLQPK